jgi:predicted nucleotidyltransferase
MVQFDETLLARLCAEHHIRRLRVFGSVARGEEHEKSDIDLIADFSSRIGFFALMDAEDSLAEFFGRDVDLLTEPGLSPFMRDAILSEAEVLFDADA